MVSILGQIRKQKIQMILKGSWVMQITPSVLFYMLLLLLIASGVVSVLNNRRLVKVIEKQTKAIKKDIPTAQSYQLVNNSHFYQKHIEYLVKDEEGIAYEVLVSKRVRAFGVFSYYEVNTFRQVKK